MSLDPILPVNLFTELEGIRRRTAQLENLGRQAGERTPPMLLPWSTPTPLITTAAAWGFSVLVEVTSTVLGDVLDFLCGVQTDAGTTGELRLINRTTGATTDPVAIPAGAYGYASLKWLHGLPLGWSGDARLYFIQAEVRRTAGTGNVVAWRPYGSRWISSRSAPGAAANGAPEFIAR